MDDIIRPKRPSRPKVADTETAEPKKLVITEEGVLVETAPDESITAEGTPSDAPPAIPLKNADKNVLDFPGVVDEKAEPNPLDYGASPTESIQTTGTKSTKKLHRLLFFKHTRLSKKQWLLVGVVLLLLLGGGSYAALAAYRSSRHVAPQGPVVRGTPKPPPPPPAPKPTTEPSRLTGVEVDPAFNQRPVTGIMIENSPDARPQSGLKEAGIVFEAIAEGGITRFLALFQDTQPTYIGPVRSIRPYYLDFLMPFDASIAHVGGAPQALADIKSLGLRDLDQFFNSQAYWRIKERYAPHNVYTSFEGLNALNSSKGYNSSTFTSFPRKKEAPDKVAPFKSINLAISGPLYNAHYDYDAATNSYKRSQAGGPHVDAKSGEQLAPKTVVALVMERGIASDGQHTEYQDVGKGHMYVFQDGTSTEGTWQKADRAAQFVFSDGGGQPLKLNPGQTWITIVDDKTSVTAGP